MRAIEFYCGIGGFAQSIPPGWEVVAAVDQNQLALTTYGANHEHPIYSRNILGIDAPWLRRFGADFWWMSPPCKPYTVRGSRADVDDPRAQSFVHLLELVRTVRPKGLGVENVPGFLGSRAHRLLHEALSDCGYYSWEGVICPTRFGIPNRRKRFYLVASQTPLANWRSPDVPIKPLSDFVRPSPTTDLWLSREVLEAYQGAIHVVNPYGAVSGPVCNCFTSAYGRSVVRSGSYLQIEHRVRRFTANEIAGILGFPESFHFPINLSARQTWALVGNSLSVVVVRSLLSMFDGERTKERLV